MPDPVYFSLSFDTEKSHKDYNVENNNLTVVAKTSSSKTAFLSETWDKGVKRFAVKLSKIKNGQYIEVGIAQPGHDNKKFVGDSKSSWGFGSDAMKYYDGKNVAYGKKFGQGDIIKCTVNFQAKSISFSLNGIDQGIAYTQIQMGKIIPCVSIHYQDDEISIVKS